MEMPKFSRCLCIGTAVALLMVSVFLAILQSAELQLGCLLSIPGQDSPISPGKQTGSVVQSYFGLQQGCGRASARYSGGTSTFNLRSVLPIVRDTVSGKAGLSSNDTSSAAPNNTSIEVDVNRTQQTVAGTPATKEASAQGKAIPKAGDSSAAHTEPVQKESPARSGERPLRIVPWPTDSGVVLDSVPKEPPKVRFEYDNWRAPDPEELLHSVATGTPSSPDSVNGSERSLLNQGSLRDVFPQPSWEWGDSMLPLSAKGGLEERILIEESSAQPDGKSSKKKQPGPMHEHIMYTLPDSNTRFGKRCAHKLSHIEEPVEVMNRVWERESGGTAAHIFRARHPNSRSGYAVAKVLCMPFGKRGSEHLAPDCSEDSNESTLTTAMAQDKLAHDCGFEEIIPRMWIGPVNAFSPNGSRFLEWDALWTEEASGISLDKLSFASAPIVDSNKSALVDRDYLEELLLKKCSPYKALGDAWRKCAFDSIFLPTSQKHAITNLGFWFTMKLPSDNPPKEPGGLGIQHVMDYRCHAPGGKIGRDYTQKFEQCLKRISSSTYRQVQQEFGLSKMHKAVALHKRASDLLHKGFEWTLINGEPKNEWPHRYPIVPACCSVHFSGSSSECTHDHTSWVPHNDTHNCGNPSQGSNPAPHINEQECLDPDGRRRSGYWQQEDGKTVPVSASGDAKWVTVSDPDWAKRDRYRFAGIWDSLIPDADFLIED